MKHLRRIFESVEVTKEDILENFLYITDKLGEPTIHSNKFGDSKKWILIWNLGLDITHLQEAHSLINKLKSIVEEIDDVISASERLSDWSFNMSLSTDLRIEMVPKDTGSDIYNFIVGYDFRTLKVSKSEIERFFAKNNITVAKWDLDSSWNEINSTNNLEITISRFDNEIVRNFINLFEHELEIKKDEIHREYVIFISYGKIIIQPQEEKACVDLV